MRASACGLVVPSPRELAAAGGGPGGGWVRGGLVAGIDLGFGGLGHRALVEGRSAC
jgi:hypothetical protein